MWEFPLTLWRSNRGQFRLNLDPPKCFFLFNFTRILYFFWDLILTLLDIPKDVVFSNILVFSNIFGFPAVHWAPKRNKTVNFGCFPFILKDFSNTYWRLSLVKISARLNNIRGSKGPKNPKRGHFMDVESIQNFTTTNAILKVFHFAKSWGTTQKFQEGINKKPHKIS